MSIHNNCGLCKASVVNLSVYDGDEAIIYDVNMEFHCGEITALIGKNGSGKTTLIKALLGERPHTGNITYLDHKDGKIKKLTISFLSPFLMTRFFKIPSLLNPKLSNNANELVLSKRT